MATTERRSTQRPLLVAILLAPILLPACSSTNPEGDANVEEEWALAHAERNAQVAATGDYYATLLSLDKAMDKYAEARSRDGYDRAERVAKSIEEYLTKQARKHIDALILTAEDPDPKNAAHRARALGVLGFYRPENEFGEKDASPRDVMAPLLNALVAEDEAVVNNAVFALGVLRDPRTPITTLGNMLEDPKRSERQRMGLANTLVLAQEVSFTPERARPHWMRVLGATQENHGAPWVLIQALRGLGHFRKPEDAELAEPYLAHPTPLVRHAAAIALGYMRARSSHEALIARLDADETNANVRLAVRKALQALAGGVDRGYDVKQWRRVFSDG